MNECFDERAAASYESWYDTPEGARADTLEMAALRRLLEDCFESRSEPGNDNRTILEVGCGTGHFTRWLREEGWTAVGLDLSGPMLEEAQTLNGVPLVRADAGRLPFADGAFDVASFITTLEFLEQPDAAVAEAVRVAREGLVLGVLNRWSVLALRRRLAGLFRPTVYDQARFFGVGALERRLRDVADDTARVVWRTTLFPGWRGDLLPWLQSWGHLPCGGFIAIALHRG